MYAQHKASRNIIQQTHQRVSLQRHKTPGLLSRMKCTMHDACNTENGNVCPKLKTQTARCFGGARYCCKDLSAETPNSPCMQPTNDWRKKSGGNTLRASRLLSNENDFGASPFSRPPDGSVDATKQQKSLSPDARAHVPARTKSSTSIPRGGCRKHTQHVGLFLFLVPCAAWKKDCGRT